MDDFEKELKVGFLEEAVQLLADAEQCFLALESNPQNMDNLNKIFRVAHNLKGSSKAVGFDKMGALTHEFETFILKVKNGEMQPTPAVVSLLLRCNDFITQMVDGLRADLAAVFDIEPLLKELTSPVESPTENSVGSPVESQVEAPPEAEQSAPSMEMLESSTPEPMEETPVALAMTVVSETVAPAPVTAPVLAAAEPALTPTSTSKAASVDESIRVSLSKVEALLNSVGEMVILQSVLQEQLRFSESAILRKTQHQLGKVSKEIQDLSMSLRMVPIKPTFQKMQRIVRDTALALQKDVAIKVVGEETELDKTVLEKINDPLVHLIRNSVDHGIESGDVRATSGKPAQGLVTLSAFQKSGKLVLEVADDGGGLNAEKLKKKAIEKGLIKPGAVLSESDAYDLIFAPGFSTKEAVSDVSGRGVGMDVVKTNIQELSGEIHIRSAVGKGTTFQIVLPLTLAIIEGMTVVFGPDKYVLPFGHVHETLRPVKSDLQFNSSLGLTLMLRGENVPIFRLGDFFGKKSHLPVFQMIAIVIRSGPKPFALFVDDILGQTQVVVKPLGPEMKGFVGVGGSTILGDGKPALILEPLDLIKRKMSPMSATDLEQGVKVA